MPYYFICSAWEIVDGEHAGTIQFGVHSAYNDFDRLRNRIKENLKADLHKKHPYSRVEVVLQQPTACTAEIYTLQPKTLELQNK